MGIQLSENDFLEDVFGSKGRIRVLRALVEEGEMNISQLAWKTWVEPLSRRRAHEVSKFPGSYGEEGGGSRVPLESWKECNSTLGYEYIGIDVGVHIPASDSTLSVAKIT